MYTSEKLFSRLMHMKMFFKPYSWDKKINNNIENYIVKNIYSNSSYTKISYKLDKIISKYPMKKNIDDSIYGFILKNNFKLMNLFEYNAEEMGKYIAYWSKFKKEYKNIIRQDLDFIKTKNLKGLLEQKNNIPEIYNYYLDKKISGYILPKILIRNSEDLNDIKNKIKENQRSLEYLDFINKLYFFYKINKIIEISKI